MGYIKEPKGIDFIIQSEPLTDKAKAEISEFIRNYKSLKTTKRTILKRTKSKKKLQTI